MMNASPTFGINENGDSMIGQLEWLVAGSVSILMLFATREFVDLNGGPGHE